MTTVTLNTNLTQSQADALAYFLEKVGWSEIRDCTTHDPQAYEVRSALTAVEGDLVAIGDSAQ
jgi:hypothetical protein